MAAPTEVVELFERFKRNYDSYKAAQYNETQLRREFVDPLFEALGWDVNNKQGYAEAYKEVIHEDSVRIDQAQRSPDYSIRIGGVRKFFVETKKPSVNLKDDPSPAFQVRRYGWSAKLPVSILTDFEEFAVYDTRIKPNEGDKASTARIEYLRGDDILTHWDERIARRFSREAVLRGDFDRYCGPMGKRRGTQQVDDAFLEQIEEWRVSLARVLALRNPDLNVEQLNLSVQTTIDRIVFLRIAEDRGLEEEQQLLKAVRQQGAYAELLKLFNAADDRYNSGLFHLRPEANRRDPDRLTPQLRIDDKTLKDIVESLYYPKSPYEFSVLSADILGHVYERFLGQVIRLTPGHKAVIEPKPEVRKAGGVYYTPTFVVRHMVAAALGPHLDGRSPKQIASTRILDPACGSGSFLLEVYQHLLDWYEAWYVSDGASKWSKAKAPTLRPAGDGWKLTTAERKRILLAHVYGVDIDRQAVEVTKLSLLLKVLEGETNQNIRQLVLLHDRALPDLDRNIKCGNSLIGSDFLTDSQGDLLDESVTSDANLFDWEAEFPKAFRDAGFDVVVGNPPYVLLQDEFRNDDHLQYFRRQYKVAAFKLDTYHLFIERSLSLVKPGGSVSLITPSNFLTNNNLVGLRRMLLTDAAIEALWVVDGGVFYGISVDNAIFVLRAKVKPTKQFVVQRVVPENGTFRLVASESVSTKVALADPHVLFAGSSGKEVTAVWRRIDAASVELGAVADVNFGKQLRDRKIHTRDVIEVKSVAAVPRGYRACYTGKDLGRYYVAWNGLACLNKEEARSGGCWDPVKQDAKLKLLTKQIGRVPDFGIDVDGHQCLNTMFMVNVRDDAIDPYLLLGQLNSRISRAIWIDRFYDRRRTFPKIKGTYLKKLPVFSFDSSNKRHNAAAAKIVQLVKRVLALSGKRAAVTDSVTQRQVGQLERAIDLELYQLYDLKPEAIAEIEKLAEPTP